MRNLGALRDKLTAVLTRHGAVLGALATAILAVVVLLPGLGSTGLWDPWEMDRAHVAREMAGRTKVVAVTLAHTGGESPLLERVRELGGDRFRVAQATSGGAARGRQQIRALKTTLERDTAHLLLIELAAVVRDLNDAAALAQGVRLVDEVVASYPGVLVGYDTSGLGEPEAVRKALSAARVRDIVRDLQTKHGVLRDVPRDRQDALADELAADDTYRVRGTFFAGPEDPALAALIEEADGVQCNRAQFRSGNETSSLPVLDYWLMAASYKLFGASELSARLPHALWGFIGLVLLALVTRRLFGLRAALLATVVLATTPLFSGSARNVSGEISAAVCLLGVAGAFLVLAREGLRWPWLVVFLVSAVLGFLAQGLTFLLLGWVVVLGYVLVMGRLRKATLIPLASLTVLFVGAIFLVLGPSEWTFFSHFKFMDRLFSGGPDPGIRNFDYFVRQLGFGLAPWTAFLPFAVGRLWLSTRDDEGRDRDFDAAPSIHGLVLWFGLPVVVLAAMLADFSHCVLPVAPAVAVLVGVFLDDVLKGAGRRGFLAFGSFVILLIVMKQLKDTPEALTSFLTFDPHFAVLEGNQRFPEAVKMSRLVRYLVMLAGLAIMVYGLRLGTLLRKGSEFFRRPRALWTAMFSLAVLLIVVLFGFLMWRFQVTLSVPGLASIPHEIRWTVKRVMLGPLGIGIYALLGVGFLLYLLAYSEWARGLHARRPRLAFFGRLARLVPQRWFLVTAGLVLAGGAAALFVPMAQGWSELAAIAYPDQPDTYVHDLLFRSRLTLGIVAVMGALVLNAVWPAGWRRYAKPFRALELLERPAVAFGAFIVAAAVFILSTLQGFYPALAMHVSQKHILDTYLAAENRTDIGQDIFKHGKFANTGQREANFYTNRIPAVTDRSTVLSALLQREDVLARLDWSSAAAGDEAVVLRGFDPRNDRNGDGRRDWPATAGVIDRLGQGFFEDDNAGWEPDAWKGQSLFIDGHGPLRVTGNTATRVAFEGTVPPVAGNSPRRYAIDTPDALVHEATAMELERVFFLLPKQSFSELNHSFRKRSGGAHVPLLDAASSRLVLATSQLGPDERDDNWIAAAVTTEDGMRTTDWFPDSDRDRFVPVYANWDDKIEILGYVLEKPSVPRRENYRIKMFFRCRGELKTSYKIFMHVDRPGTAHRIHSDHWPLNLEKSAGDDPEKTCRGCFQTRHWIVGDIAVDSFEREVPLGTPSGPQDLWLGFYTPGSDKRLPVKEVDEKTVQHDGSNRVKIGSFQVP